MVAVSKLGIDRLVVLYEESARLHEVYSASGDHRRANRSADGIAEVYRELRRRGVDAQCALLRLLDDPCPGVRGWAAAHALEFAPENGEPVLEGLASGSGFPATNARMTLKVWRDGQLMFP